MSLGSDEIERIMDEAVADRGIETSLHCATCGYNLRGLPYSGLCPECGNLYSARDYRFTGIFIPQRLEFPVSEVFSSLTCLVMALLLLRWSLTTRSMFLGAAFFGALTFFFIRLTWQRLARYVHFRQIARRIERDL